MKIGKSIERAARALLLAPATLARYGTLRPEKVKMWDRDNWIHIDPSDRRAIKKLVQDQVRKRTGPPLRFWRDFLVKLRPAIAIDVGVNYGECLFGASYDAGTKVYGFEANPHLVTYLKRSREDHQNSENITIIEGLVSDTIEDGIPFYTNPSWSGTGSAIPSLNKGPDVIKTEISARTIDSVIPRESAQGANLLFKMDIEGFEPRAFNGFWETIDATELTVGFVEFDTTFVREAGDDPEAYFKRLEERFDIHRLVDGKAGKITKVTGFDSLPKSRASDQRVHTDLLLITKGAEPGQWLPEDWSISDS